MYQVVLQNLVTWLAQRYAGGYCSGAGRVRCELLTASTGVSKLCSFFL